MRQEFDAKVLPTAFITYLIVLEDAAKVRRFRKLLELGDDSVTLQEIHSYINKRYQDGLERECGWKELRAVERALAEYVDV